ncbi:Serine/threonine protein kinase [Handroanthus impetiginosus]|uniref:Receptor-like serine/threonine-protein kinase n=1 Tax=Handroanthus impetiginosus TaxID=429701 RepID=A0A2G9H932_9LAMI|nr:Serine/threonine protein kinase [Handroanthus impetiginosus]
MNTFNKATSLLLIISSLFYIQKMSLAMDTITTTQIIKDGDTIVSSGGSFELGFLSPGDSKNRYVGIWYKKITVKTAVWIANRQIPLKNISSGILKVVKPGILVLLNETNGIIWSTNTSVSVRNPVAQLLDSGNLVIKEASDNNPKNYVWQSFDYPTDTLLAGMKLGWNFVNHLEVYLSSWKNNDDPASGDFTYHCDPTGYPQDVLRKGGVKQYTTGPWTGLTFSGLPSLRTNQIFKFGLVMNKNEVYFHYDLLNSSIISRVTLNQSGVAQRLTWSDQAQSWVVYFTAPSDNCDLYYNLCGAYGVCSMALCKCLNKFVPKDRESWDRGDWSSGCVRRTSLDCEKGDNVFLKYSGIKLPDAEHSWYNQSVMNLEECKMLCLKNCSCTAYTNINASAGGHTCLLWFGDLVDIKELSAREQDIYIRMSSSELDSRGSKRKILIVSLSLVMGIALVGLSLMVCAQKRRKIRLLRRSQGEQRLGIANNHEDESQKKELELPLFDLYTISKATDNFSNNKKIGEGGFGPVYKGQLEGGQEIAVKRLSRTSLQGIDEFKNEVICVAKLQHRNLVKLLGCCIQGQEYLLIYEYMPNKSLDLILFNPAKSTFLDWPRRFHIINGIARGLLYLHEDSRLRIIHRDLKASNVLLDSDMNPKISDFGLARSFGGNETGANTSRVVGTYGYMSPEYAVDGVFSVKSDVFSFGVLVLEIVSGKRNRGFSHRDHDLNLLGHAWMLHKEGRALELVDSYGGKSSYLSQVLRSIHICLLCVQQYPEDRPSMSSVVFMLANEGVLPQAKKPGFFTERDVLESRTSGGTSTPSSTNEMSITLLEAR